MLCSCTFPMRRKRSGREEEKKKKEHGTHAGIKRRNWKTHEMQGRRMLGAGQGWSGHAARSQGLCSDSRSHATSHHSRGGCRGVVPRHAGVQHRLSFHFGATVQQPHVCVDRHRWFEGYPLYHTTCLPRWRMTHHSEQTMPLTVISATAATRAFLSKDRRLLLGSRSDAVGMRPMAAELRC